jgi:DNA-binding transcriptional MerR regulator
VNDRVDDPDPADYAGARSGGQTGAREYRVEELAQAAGIPVRTLRFYRERRLLPPPRRDGRIAWYSDSHLARLRTIAALLERGHTLGGITELITAWENGRTLNGVAELLGVGDTLAAPWSDETPVVLTPQELADYFGEDASPENLTAALEIGYISVAGESALHTSRRLLDVSAALVREGVPLAAVLAAGREVRGHADAIAEVFTQVVKTHVLGPLDDAPPEQAQRISDAMQRLRPLAKDIVDAEMSLAMERRVRIEIDGWLRRQAAAGGPGAGTAQPEPSDVRQDPQEPDRDG